MDNPTQAAGLIIDLDGVLWRGPQWLPGVKAFFDQQRRLGRRLMLVTNNATASTEGVVSRLAAVDVALEPDEVLTSSVATAQYLREHHPDVAKIYPIGEAGLRDALTGAGFTLLDTADSAQAVVVGFDREISWYKLKEAAIAIGRGARFIGTNPDPSFPVPEGLAPGNGAFVGALQLTTGVSPIIVGKPEPLLYQQAATAMKLDPAQILVIGDRLGTDILGAIRAGMKSALLLTGVTTAAQAEADEIQASWVFEDLPALTQALDHA